MSKRKALDISALESAAGDTVAPIKKLEAQQSGKPPSRADKVQVGAFVSEDMRTRLKMLALEQGRSLSDVLEEAFELVLSHHHK